MGTASYAARTTPLFLCFILMALLVAGCGGGAGGGATSAGGLGSLVLTFETPREGAMGLIPSSTRTLIVDLQNADTGVSAINPVVLEVDPRQSYASTTIGNIEQGAYLILVTAKDSSGATVGSGRSSVTVRAGVETVAEVNVTSSGGGGGAVGKRVIVCNLNDGTLSVIDSGTDSVIKTISVDGSPFDVDWTPDGSKFLVTDIRNYYIYVFNAADYSLITSIYTGHDAPYDITLRPGSSSDTTGFFTIQSSYMKKVDYTNYRTDSGWDQGSGRITQVLIDVGGVFVYALGDTSANSGQVQQLRKDTLRPPLGRDPVSVGGRPILGALNGAGTRLYTSNEASGMVSVIQLSTMNVIATITVGNAPSGIAALPLEAKVFVSNTPDNTVSVIDTLNNRVSGTITGFNNPLRIAVLDDGTKVFVVNKNGNSVSVLSPAANTISRTINVGSSPNGISVEP
jgi:YVTN family beta-propeller protein